MTLQATKWEEKSARDRTEEGLMFTMYKELLQISKKNKRRRAQLNKWAKYLNRHFTKEDIQMARIQMKSN